MEADQTITGHAPLLSLSGALVEIVYPTLTVSLQVLVPTTKSELMKIGAGLKNALSSPVYADWVIHNINTGRAALLALVEPESGETRCAAYFEDGELRLIKGLHNAPVSPETRIEVTKLASRFPPREIAEGATLRAIGRSED